MCFNSVLIPPVNRGPPEFFLIWIASKWHIPCKFWGGVCGNQLQFWNRILIHLCIILNKSIVVNFFFLARDRSLKLNTSFSSIIRGRATWIFRDWLSPASKSRYGWKIAKSTLIIKTTNNPVLYFDEVSIYNVIEFELSKIRDTDRPVPLY